MVFAALKAYLQEDDSTKSLNSLKLSWNNYGLKILVRLDCFHVFKNLATAYRRIILYKIRGDVGWSDDLPVELLIQLKAGRTRLSCYHMGT